MRAYAQRLSSVETSPRRSFMRRVGKGKPLLSYL
jgi:hypothetical protein